MNWKWLFSLVLFPLASLLFFSQLACQKTATTVESLSKTYTDTVDDLEQSGADYDIDMALTGDWHVSWTPFGFNSDLAGSYFRANVHNGSGPKVKTNTVNRIRTTTQPSVSKKG